MSRPTVVLVGTLDTKGEEYAYLRERLEAGGVDTLLVDVGTQGPPLTRADVPPEDVAAAGGFDLAALTDRGAAVEAMCAAAPVVVRRLFDEGRCQGVLAAGGSGNTAIATAAMRALPVGVPKLVVSTMAAGDTTAYVDVSDVTLMPAVTDVSGLNSVSMRILANAAAAVAGMVTAPPVDLGESRPVVAATMFGVTTPAVTAAREELERRGYEVLVFHATGTGGRAMEKLVDDGLVSSVLDITTTEVCDLLVGGIFAAGPDRLDAVARTRVPYVGSCGALDMVNFGGRATVPSKFADRLLYEHNPQVTLMRTTAAENVEIGRFLAEKLNRCAGPVLFLLPEGGVSALDSPGQAFWDPDADAALFTSIEREIRDPGRVRRVPHHINDPEFADALVAAWREVQREVQPEVPR
jgi:uncharacterized protein (UPF0261 family)